MALHNQLGNEGEKIAVNYLKNKGYIIYHTNWRMSHLEVDIIAEDNGELVFIEVKTRRRRFGSRPLDAVTLEKQDLIERGARSWLALLPHKVLVSLEHSLQ